MLEASRAERRIRDDDLYTSPRVRGKPFVLFAPRLVSTPARLRSCDQEAQPKQSAHNATRKARPCNAIRDYTSPSPHQRLVVAEHCTLLGICFVWLFEWSLEFIYNNMAKHRGDGKKWICARKTLFARSCTGLQKRILGHLPRSQWPFAGARLRCIDRPSQNGACLSAQIIRSDLHAPSPGGS